MPLHPSAQLENLEKSLNAYVKMTLEGTEGLQVHYPHVRDFAPQPAWISVSYGLLSMAGDYSGVLSATEDVARREGLIECTVCVQANGQNNIYQVARIRDQVVHYFPTGLSLPVFDYAPPLPVLVGVVHVGMRTERLMTEGELDGLMQYSISIPVTYLERTT